MWKYLSASVLAEKTSLNKSIWFVDNKPNFFFPFLIRIFFFGIFSLYFSFFLCPSLCFPLFISFIWLIPITKQDNTYVWVGTSILVLVIFICFILFFYNIHTIFLIFDSRANRRPAFFFTSKKKIFEKKNTYIIFKFTNIQKRVWWRYLHINKLGRLNKNIIFTNIKFYHEFYKPIVN